jgi:hypothetical protein
MCTSRFPGSGIGDLRASVAELRHPPGQVLPELHVALQLGPGLVRPAEGAHA